jgi:hypothetical protein
MNPDKNPADSLATEHRRVERYPLLMKRQAELMGGGKNPDRLFTERLIDFSKSMRTDAIMAKKRRFNSQGNSLPGDPR